MFVVAIRFFNFNLSNVNCLECISGNNHKCKIRSDIINVNTNGPVFCHYSITINKCKGSSNTINDPYSKLFVSDTFENINVKVFNLVLRTNGTSMKLVNANVD